MSKQRMRLLCLCAALASCGVIQPAQPRQEKRIVLENGKMGYLIDECENLAECRQRSNRACGKAGYKVHKEWQTKAEQSTNSVITQSGTMADRMLKGRTIECNESQQSSSPEATTKPF